MAEVVYVLCALASVTCAGLLLRAYRSSASRLLLWAGLCFVGLALNNALLVLDLVVLGDDLDLSTMRQAPAVAGFAVLVYGLVWETE